MTECFQKKKSVCLIWIWPKTYLSIGMSEGKVSCLVALWSHEFKIAPWKYHATLHLSDQS